MGFLSRLNLSTPWGWARHTYGLDGAIFGVLGAANPAKSVLVGHLDTTMEGVALSLVLIPVYDTKASHTDGSTFENAHTYRLLPIDCSARMHLKTLSNEMRESFLLSQSDCSAGHILWSQSSMFQLAQLYSSVNSSSQAANTSSNFAIMSEGHPIPPTLAALSDSKSLFIKENSLSAISVCECLLKSITGLCECPRYFSVHAS